MQLFCPVCQGAFAGTQRCPQCGGLLLLPQEAAEATAPRPKDKPKSFHMPTPAGRVTVGALFALGMYLGLRKLVVGVLFASQLDQDAWWTSFEGLSVVCGAQVLSVLFGAVVAAAGRTGGLGFGGAVGAMCGSAFLAAELLAGAPAQDLVLYVQPLVLVGAGAIAGVIAARVWGAVPVLNMPLTDGSRLSSSRFALEVTKEPSRPTSWLRALAGAMAMVLAVTAAEQVRYGAQKYSGGLLRVETMGQGQFLTWQIAVLGVMAGGVIAGSGTGAGIRHGALAGLFGSVGVVGMTVAAGKALRPVAYWLNKLALGDLAPNDPAAVLGAASGILILAVFGGWLGGTLFLPLAPEHLRKPLGNHYD